MAAKANHFKLGLFVITATALLLIGLALLGADALFRETISLETYMSESVQGLEEGAPVKVRGVSVGRVSGISFVGSKYPVAMQEESDRFAYSGLILVELELDKQFIDSQEGVRQGKYEAYLEDVKRGLRIRMASSGLTGPPFLSIEMLDPKTYPALEVPWEPEFLYMPAAPSTLGQFMSAAESIMQQIEDAEIDKVAADARELMGQIESAVEAAKVEQIASDVRSFLKRAEKAVEDAKVSDLSDEAKALIAEVRASNAAVRKIIEHKDVEKTVAQAPAAVADIRKLVRRLDTLVVTQRDDIQTIISNLRQITENLEALSESAKDYPSQVILGDPPPPKDDME